LHTGINNVKVAKHIDMKYAELLQEALNAGVEILIYKAEISAENVYLSKRIPFIK